MSSTNTAMPTPTCENCGRDKTPTYICDACCDKLNAITRKRASDYAKLDAENAELRKCLEFSQGEALELRKHRKPLRDLAAANATLDRMREVVRSDDDEWQDWEPGDLMRLASAVHAILYPTPENDNEH